MNEAPAPDGSPWSAVLESYVEVGEDLPEPDLVDCVRLVYKLLVDQTSTVKECHSHALPGSQCSLRLLGSGLH